MTARGWRLGGRGPKPSGDWGTEWWLEERLEEERIEEGRFEEERCDEERLTYSPNASPPSRLVAYCGPPRPHRPPAARSLALIPRRSASAPSTSSRSAWNVL